MTIQEKLDEAQQRAMAIAMALGRGSTIADANDAVAGFLNELQRRGYMVVPQNYGKETLEPVFFYDPDEWETTHTHRDHAVDDLRDSDKLELGKVAALGRLLELPTIYLVSIPIEDGGREIEEYATREEAERRAAWVATPRSLLKLDDIKPGDRLRADDAFTCLDEDQVVTVEADGEREGTAALFAPCDDGRHYLDGQEDEDGTCIGFERIEAPAP